MYKSLEQALYRAFNIVEMFYQKSPLSDLYKTPDWENHTGYTDSYLTPAEKVEMASRVYRLIKNNLLVSEYTVLRITYCRSMGADEWRNGLATLTPEIMKRTGRIKFNRCLYEYVCISHLTGNKIKELHIKNKTVRNNKRRVCSILDSIIYQAHESADRVLCNHGVFG